MRKNILITGLPKSGKSTLLKNVIQNIEPKVGFVTLEVSQNGERVGFALETSSGAKAPLAHINFRTDIKVSRYFVDLNNLEQIIGLVNNFNNHDTLYLDEIGQMELFSASFKSLVEKYLDSPNLCLATLSQIYHDQFTEKLRKRNDTIIVQLTAENRQEKLDYLNSLLKKIAKAKKYLADPTRFSVSSKQVKLKSDHGHRILTRQKQGWRCSCEFFQINGVCSHVIALEEYLSSAPIR